MVPGGGTPNYINKSGEVLSGLPKWKIIWTYCGYILCFSTISDAQCEFPVLLQNSPWTSSNFGIMTFSVSNVTFNDGTARDWTCFLNNGSQYVVKSVEPLIQFGQSAYEYYCLDLTRHNDNSYSFYLQSDLDISNKRKKTFLPSTTPTAIDSFCDVIVDVAEFHVLVKDGFESSAKQYCVTPLLGSFNYTFTQDGTDQCGSAPGTGRVDVCTPDKTTITYDYAGGCSQVVSYSSSGVVYCLASVTKEDGTGATYYQSLYNTDTIVTNGDTRRFACIAVTYTVNDDGNYTTYVSQIHSDCIAGQSSTSQPSTGATLVMTSYAVCRTSLSESASGGSSTSSVIGAVIGVIVAVVVVAVGIFLFYFCYYSKIDRTKHKHIVENTKPRFEDPDVTIEDFDYTETRSTPVTREDITFDTHSPSYVSYGRRFPDRPITISPTESSAIVPNGLPNSNVHFRAKMNRGVDSMVIFDDDEGPISMFIPKEIPLVNSLKLEDMPRVSGGTETFRAVKENGGVVNYMGDLSPDTRVNLSYPTLPREKSNLLPPIETAEPERENTQ